MLALACDALDGEGGALLSGERSVCSSSGASHGCVSGCTTTRVQETLALSTYHLRHSGLRLSTRRFPH